MKRSKKCYWMFLLALLLVLIISTGLTTAQAAANVKLNKKSVKIEQQSSYKLKLKGAAAKKVKWSSGEKTVASVKKGVVKAKKVGTCVITAKYKGKKYTCNVKVTTNNPKKYTGAVKVFKEGNTGFGVGIKITVVRTQKQLYAYLKKLRSKKITVEANESEKKYLKRLGRYDAAYFKKHSLILVTSEESSGSDKLSYEGITCENEKYTVNLTCERPSIRDHSMCYWQFVIETDNKAIKNNNVKLQTETVDLGDVTMSAQLNEACDTLTLVISNTTDKEYGMGLEFTLRHYADKTWTDVNSDTPVISIAQVIPANGTTSQTIRLGDFYDSLKKGQYWLTKNVYSEDGTRSLLASFTLDSDMVYTTSETGQETPSDDDALPVAVVAGTSAQVIGISSLRIAGTDCRECGSLVLCRKNFS